MAEYKRYSDEDKASALAALDANGGNLKRTSRETHIPISTLKRWRDGQINHGVAELRPQKTLELAELIDAEIREIFQAMKTKRGDAFYSQLATTVGILIDKKQLLVGEPTSRSDIRLNVPPLPDDQLENIFSGKNKAGD